MRELSLVIPGSTSNLGAGFDCIGLALGIYSRMTFTLLDNPDPGVPLISYSGAIAEHSSADATSHLSYRMLMRMWENDKKLLSRIRIKIDSDIPLGCGLGSGSAAIAGALWAANFFQDRMPTQSELLAEATRLEGHSEMLAACLMGGFVVCASADGKFTARSHIWPSRWRLVFVVPSHRHDTAHARSLLPKKVPFEDAVFNVQHASLLVSAVVSQDENALREALADRLHEQYRTSYAGHLMDLKKLLQREPVMGTVLSGAGPSVLVVVDERNKAGVIETLKQWEMGQPQRYTILDLASDSQGIRELAATI